MDETFLTLLIATLAVALRTYVGVMLVVSGLTKLRQGMVFEAVLGAYRVLPAGLVGPVARVLPLVELALGAALLLARFVPLVSACVAALLLVFAGAVAINLLRGRRHISCGCGIAPDGQGISEALVLSNLALAGLLILSSQLAGPASVILAVGAMVAGAGTYLLVQVVAMMAALGAGARKWSRRKG